MNAPIEHSELSTADRAEPAPIRASDADRAATVLQLQDAVGQGCLTPGEGSERMGRAFAAVHRSDLAPLTVDLPNTAALQQDCSKRDRLSRWLTSHDRVRLALLVLSLVLLLVLAGAVVAHLALDSGPGPFPGSRRRF